MEHLGFILIAFVCSTPVSAPEGHHDCYIGAYSHHVIVTDCFKAGNTLKIDFEDAGARVVRRACRTPLPSDPMYNEIIRKLSY